MNKLLLIGLEVILSASFVVGENNKTFPDNFMFGVTTSAYQVEGGWDEDGKGETIWDYLVHHKPTYVVNNDTGDVACDSYHKYAEDVALAADLGIRHYKFSISWSRIFPNGLGNEVNLMGVSYYQNIIELLESYNITPVVTLYHWDLPQQLQDIGGWTNPSMVQYFVKYARAAFQYFDTVKYWVTFDEPKQICRGGYGTETLAPQIALDGVADYLCSYVVIKAHAEVYNLYRKEFSDLEGKIAIVLDVPWSEPYSDEAQDIEAAERRNQFEVGLYANPLVHGNWPEVVINRVEERSANENFTRTRLPQFTDDEIVFIKGSYDFIGLNFYDTRYVADAEEADYEYPSFEHDMRATIYADDAWLKGINGDTIVKWGIRRALNWLKTSYYNPTILITQNSIATNGTLDDYDRIQSIYDYLNYMLDAVYEDNVAVIGYTLNLLDEFEWKLGYSAHEGLFSVDFEDTNRTRTPKRSAYYYQQIAMSLTLPDVPIVSSTTNPTTEVTTATYTTIYTTTKSLETTNPSTEVPTGSSTIESSETTNPSTEVPTGSSTIESSETTNPSTEVPTGSPTTVEPPTSTPGSSYGIKPQPLFILAVIVFIDFKLAKIFT